MIRSHFQSPTAKNLVLVIAGLALLVLLAIRPALQMLESARSQAPVLQAQRMQLLEMQAQAKALQAQGYLVRQSGDIVVIQAKGAVP